MKNKKTAPKKQKKCQFCKKEEAWITAEDSQGKQFRLCIECLKTAVGNLL